MSQIVTWEYYSSLFNEVNESTFNKLEPQAEQRLDIATHFRSSEYVDSYDETTASPFQNKKYSSIKYAICVVVNKLQANSKSASGNGITSVSNNGYSETYAVTTTDQANAEISSIISNCLSGTGLCSAL